MHLELINYIIDCDFTKFKELLEANKNEPIALGFMLFNCAEHNSYEIFKYLVENYWDITNSEQEKQTYIVQALERSVQYNEEEIVKLLIEKGINPNATSGKNSSLLALAIKAKNDNLAKYLIEKGADIEPKNISLQYSSPLKMAVMKNSYDMVEYLLERGANKYTALTLSIQLNQIECLKSVLKFETDLYQDNCNLLRMAKIAKNKYNDESIFEYLFNRMPDSNRIEKEIKNMGNLLDSQTIDFFNTVLLKRKLEESLSSSEINKYKKFKL